MYAITGITGQVGGAAARALLATHQPVRAVLRDSAKAAPWKDRGCDIALAEMTDPHALTAAFRNTEAVFILLPSSFDPAPGFPEVRALCEGLRIALEAARPRKIVALSTIGAQAQHENLLTQLGIMEQILSQLPIPISFLRPAWFMENTARDIEPARATGLLHSFLQPLDKPFPMVATADIGHLAAELLQQTWTGRRIIELEGPARITPNQIAATLSALLNRPIRANAVPRDTWQQLFKDQGMNNPTPRIQMLDGFNQGWIEFEYPDPRKGTTPLKTVL